MEFLHRRKCQKRSPRCSQQNVEKLATSIPDLNLDGDEIEEYSTMLLWLQNQVETGKPSEAIVKQCLSYFAQFDSRAA
jgi:hypothetical protein